MTFLYTRRTFINQHTNLPIRPTTLSNKLFYWQYFDFIALNAYYASDVLLFFHMFDKKKKKISNLVFRIVNY